MGNEVMPVSVVGEAQDGTVCGSHILVVNAVPLVSPVAKSACTSSRCEQF